MGELLKGPVKGKEQHMVKRNRVQFTAIVMFLLIFVALIMVFPFAWMVLGSVKSKSELFAMPIKWFPEVPVWKNYVQVVTKVPFFQFYWNTAKVAVISTAGKYLRAVGLCFF